MNNMAGSLAQYNEIYWPWPIALYLFLAGLSAGCLMVSLIVKFNRFSHNTNSIWDATIKAGALISPLAISLGLLLLIVDLGKPFTFYLLLIKYNFTSVMTLGVLFLLVYTPLAFLYALIIFEREIELYFRFLIPITNSIRKMANFAKMIEYVLFFLALCVGAYTGFLLSAISKVPLWNTPILPLLFVVSAFSCGIAANILVGILFFKAHLNKENIKYLLVLDLRAIMLEIPILLLLFVGMYYSGGESLISLKAIFAHEFYSKLFWFGVLGTGLILPILIAITALKNHAFQPAFIIINSLAVLVGVVMLRFFIVYAGQVCIS
ncbi:polysulfide reductase NrfD [Campylobacter sp. Cr9]|uniref:NrfD/PsrC family molybdoenzyme membrane anchor subunit n=1 Tax=Campylobacter sp. Cr9 TaxID=2735728 RepID=UPI003014A267|nr:polysulfide reductase NrfD [Campylobacter sp. Cr9]